MLELLELCTVPVLYKWLVNFQQRDDVLSVDVLDAGQRSRVNANVMRVEES